MSTEVQIAVITLIGVIVGAAFQPLIQFLTARVDRQHQLKLKRLEFDELRRTKRYEQFINRLDELAKATQEFEQFLGKPIFFREDDEGAYELASVIGKARAACLAVGDAELTRISRDVLTPNRVKKGGDSTNQDYESRNRAGLEAAIIRLTQVIHDVESTNSIS